MCRAVHSGLNQVLMQANTHGRYRQDGLWPLLLLGLEPQLQPLCCVCCTSSAMQPRDTAWLPACLRPCCCSLLQMGHTTVAASAFLNGNCHWHAVLKGFCTLMILEPANQSGSSSNRHAV